MFLHNNSLWEIMEPVREYHADPHEALEKIWHMIYKGHGTLHLEGTKIVYVPDEFAYIKYINYTSSIIKIGECSNKTNTIYAELEHLQFQEIAVINRTVERINKALLRVKNTEALIYLKSRIEHKDVLSIIDGSSISRKKYYKIKKKCDNFIIFEFKLYDFHRQRWYIEQLLEKFEMKNKEF